MSKVTLDSLPATPKTAAPAGESAPTLVVAGLNHKTAPVRLRERAAFREHQLEESYRELHRLPGVREGVILSTCNRVELYAVTERGNGAFNDLARFLSQSSSIPREELEPYLYRYSKTGAARHLFTVAASLDSMVVGETEILSQVKQAYQNAVKAESTGKLLNPLFQRAFQVAKTVHSTTRISHRKVSVSSVAVELAEKIFMDFSQKTVLVIGAGKMSRQTLQHLVEQGVSQLLVASRRCEKARALAEAFNGREITMDQLADYLHRADIVISSTAAPHLVISRELLEKTMKARRGRPIFLIDIAVPRDIDPSVSEMDGVYLYNIDDLQKVVAEHIGEREKEVEQSLEIVSRETDRYEREVLHAAPVEPAIIALRERFHGEREREILRLFARHPELPDELREEIEALTERLINRVLHPPLTSLKEHAQSEEGNRLVEAIRRLFQL